MLGQTVLSSWIIHEYTHCCRRSSSLFDTQAYYSGVHLEINLRVDEVEFVLSKGCHSAHADLR